MNYVEFHLGDYVRDTAHLSMLEDGAYRRLLDAYYTRERALPADLKQCCKLARASSKPERDAVTSVLEEFFSLEADGYHQRRADAELDRYQEKRRKASASARSRWNPSERNANALPTHCEGNALQSPVTNHQTPTIRKEREGERLPPDFGLNPERRAFCENEGCDPQRTMDTFRDHYSAASGEKAISKDWDAIWRKWCRRERDFGRGPNGSSGRMSPEAEAAWERVLAGGSRDAAMQAGVDAAGGWPRIRDRTDFDAQKIKRAFCEGYLDGLKNDGKHFQEAV